MKFVAQRVKRAVLRVNGEVVSEIGYGLVVYLGVKRGDEAELSKKCAEKIQKLRVFSDENGKLNRSVCEIGGEVLLVSQFTLYGDAKKGNRPSFTEAEAGEEANRLYEAVFSHLSSLGVPTKKGVFGADMEIEQVNDGPVTILYEI